MIFLFQLANLRYQDTQILLEGTAICTAGTLIICVGQIKPHTLPSDIETLFTEIKLRNKKYILVAGYNPHSDFSSYFLRHIGNALDKLLGNYVYILLQGEFNSTQEEQCMKDFCETYNLENLIKCPRVLKILITQLMSWSLTGKQFSKFNDS